MGSQLELLSSSFPTIINHQIAMASLISAFFLALPSGRHTYIAIEHGHHMACFLCCLMNTCIHLMRKFEVLSTRAQKGTKTPHNSGNGMETIKTTLLCEMALCQRTGKTTNCCNFGRHLFLRTVDVAGIWFCLKIGYPVPLNLVL